MPAVTRSSLMRHGLLLWCGCLIGCGGGSTGGPKLVPVTGVVTYKGQPVPGARVMFLGDGSKPPSIGVTGTDGKFSLASMTGAGAVPGTHMVAVEKEGAKTDAPIVQTMDEAMLDYQKQQQAPPAKVEPSLIPTKYTNAQTSGLTFEVKESATNHFEIVLND
jgi:hypothetical protein